MQLLFLVLILLFSVVLHEVSHGYMASLLGDPTARLSGRLTLNPIKHLDPIGSIMLPLALVLLQAKFILGWAKPVPYNPYNLRGGRWGPAYVAAAGPLSNFLIALVFGLIARLGSSYDFFPLTAVTILGAIVVINLTLGVFNLIPIPPLDGSKILFTLLPFRYHWVEQMITAYWIIAVLFVLFFFGNYIFWVVLSLSTSIAGESTINVALHGLFASF